MVGQRHLRRREATHPAERLQPEQGGEVMLPGLHVEPVVLHGRGRGDGMAPWAAEPLHGRAVARVDGDRAQGLEHVVGAHLPQSVQERARVLEHHPRLAALLEELGNELAHALVAPAEHRSVVVVLEVGVLVHVLQVADQPSAADVVPPGRDQRLVHVQRDRERRLDPGQRLRHLVAEEDRALTGRPHGLGDQRLGAADVRQPVDVLGKLAHGSVS